MEVVETVNNRRFVVLQLDYRAGTRSPQLKATGDAAMSPRRRKTSKRYAGYLLVFALYLGWFEIGLNSGALALLSGLTLLYSLFMAPMPCCAINRNGTFCRNNAYGLVLGCRFYQHRWQTVLMLVRWQSWARLSSKMFHSIAGNTATVTAITGIVSIIAALMIPFINQALGG